MSAERDNSTLTDGAGRFFIPDSFGDPGELSGDYRNMIALAQDMQRRPHDRVASDRFNFEVSDLANKLFAIVTDENCADFLTNALWLIIADSSLKIAPSPAHQPPSEPLSARSGTDTRSDTPGAQIGVQDGTP